MFPEEFKQRITTQDYVDSDALLKALEGPSPVSIRINTTKWNKRPVNAESVEWCKNGFYLAARPSYTLDPLFHSGCYYPQEASGMFIEQAVRQSAGVMDNLRVLDLCGAPGGKSTHLSELIGSSGLLVANEVIRSRASVLTETLTKWGAANTLVTQSDPSAFRRITGYFDIILVDAPCSGEGMFRNKVAVSEWSMENSIHCSERQKRIVMDIWNSLKENGILIYSTCTFNPDENEENIKWLIGRQQAECMRLDISAFKGITEIDYEGIYGYGFYPYRTRGEGLFISVIRKTGSEDKNNFRTPGIRELIPSKMDVDITTQWADFPRERLLKWGEEIFAIPSGMEDYLYLYNNLKVVKAGTKLSVVKKNNYLPSHELALSPRLKKEAFPEVNIDLEQAISFLRRDNLSFHIGVKGWNTVIYKSICLGFINNIGSRVNNYFPVEWRIRLDASAIDKTFIVGWEPDN